MNELIKQIEALSREEIEQVMDAIEEWFSVTYSDWDVVYMAVPKDPDLREKMLKSMWQILCRDIDSQRK